MTIETTTIPHLEEAYWRAEAERMHEILASVTRFCDRQHEIQAWNGRAWCGCASCQAKRRVLLIISEGLK